MSWVAAILTIALASLVGYGLYYNSQHPCLKSHKTTVHYDAQTWYQNPKNGGLSPVITGTHYIPITFPAYDAEEEICDQRK